MFIEALFTIFKKWKQPKCPLSQEWINILGILHGNTKKSSTDTSYNMGKP